MQAKQCSARPPDSSLALRSGFILLGCLEVESNVDETSLEHLIFLPPPAKCQNYRCALSSLDIQCWGWNLEPVHGATFPANIFRQVHTPRPLVC